MDPARAYALEDLLRALVAVGGSDLHLSAGAPPTVRVDGELHPLPEVPPLDGAQVAGLLEPWLPAGAAARLAEDRDLDLAIDVPGLARFRVNAFRQRGATGAVLRAIPHRVVPLELLELPPVVEGLADLPRGLVLVTGPTGSGKSTTLASLLDRVNRSRAAHILTIEDPIEFVHTHRRCLVNQREVGTDTASFATALRAALREDPDVLLVGELRDLETIEAALTAAETGHLVLATLHTQDAPQSVDRIIDVFPAHQQAQVRVQLALTLQAVVTQCLVRKADGRGRAVAAEVLVVNPAVRNLIREAKTFQIASAMQVGGALGMQTMDQALGRLVQAGTVRLEDAVRHATDADEVVRMAQRAA